MAVKRATVRPKLCGRNDKKLEAAAHDTTLSGRDQFLLPKLRRPIHPPAVKCSMKQKREECMDLRKAAWRRGFITRFGNLKTESNTPTRNMQRENVHNVNVI